MVAMHKGDITLIGKRSLKTGSRKHSGSYQGQIHSKTGFLFIIAVILECEHKQLPSKDCKP